MKLRCFGVRVKGWPYTVYESATSRGQARFLVWRAAREAGFDLPFGAMRPYREPRFDHLCITKGEIRPRQTA